MIFYTKEHFIKTKSRYLSCGKSKYLTPNKQGYTLLEVMAALIIVGISITAVTGALSTAKGLSARSDHAVESVRILKNILNNPDIMDQIVNNSNFQKSLEDEDGWICRAETEPLIIDSADISWDTDNDNSNNSNKNSSKNSSNARHKNKKNSGKKNFVGEEIEIPGMVSITICVSQENQLIEKEYCITRWKRTDSSTDTEIISNENNIKSQQ